jgi:hypothetical protein
MVEVRRRTRIETARPRRTRSATCPFLPAKKLSVHTLPCPRSGRARIQWIGFPEIQDMVGRLRTGWSRSAVPETRTPSPGVPDKILHFPLFKHHRRQPPRNSASIASRQSYPAGSASSVIPWNSNHRTQHTATGQAGARQGKGRHQTTKG